MVEVLLLPTLGGLTVHLIGFHSNPSKSLSSTSLLAGPSSQTRLAHLVRFVFVRQSELGDVIQCGAKHGCIKSGKYIEYLRLFCNVSLDRSNRQQLPTACRGLWELGNWPLAKEPGRGKE